MGNVELVLYTAIAMTLIFAVVATLVMLRYGLPYRKYDGYLDISLTDASQIHQLDITTEPKDLKDQKRVVFKVRKIPPITPSQ